MPIDPMKVMINKNKNRDRAIGAVIGTAVIAGIAGFANKKGLLHFGKEKSTKDKMVETMKAIEENAPAITSIAFAAKKIWDGCKSSKGH